MPASNADPSNEAPQPAAGRAPWIVALTGGVGSGKSTVARALARLGGVHIDADAIAHEVTAAPQILRRLQQAFGDEAVGPDGTLNREYLSQHVFGCADPTERDTRIGELNAIVHPEVRAKIDKTLEMWADRGFDERSPLPEKRPLLILDIPLLERSPYSHRASAILFIESSLEDRLQRVRESRGWSEERLREREAAQVDLAEKRKRATHVLLNPNPPQSTGSALERSAPAEPQGENDATLRSDRFLADEQRPADHQPDAGDRANAATHGESKTGESNSDSSLETACRKLIQEWSRQLIE